MSYTNYNADQSYFKSSYQLCPIFLYNGIAQNAPSQLLPITQITQLNANNIIDTDDYLCHFQPVAGGDLINFEIAEYPFANQYVAANAIIVQPLRISLRMSAPAKSDGDYINKLSVFTSLQNTLQNHSLLGGTYSVATPAYLYSNLLLAKLTDITGSDSKQVQFIWQWDFVQPLITQQQAAAAQNALMSKISNNMPIQGQPSVSGPASSPSSYGSKNISASTEHTSR